MNLHLDQSIADVEERIDSLETKQPENDQGFKDLADAIEENAKGISDNANAIGEQQLLVTIQTTLLRFRIRSTNYRLPLTSASWSKTLTTLQAGSDKHVGIADNKNRLDAWKTRIA